MLLPLHVTCPVLLGQRLFSWLPEKTVLSLVVLIAAVFNGVIASAIVLGVEGEHVSLVKEDASLMVPLLHPVAVCESLVEQGGVLLLLFEVSLSKQAELDLVGREEE